LLVLIRLYVALSVEIIGAEIMNKIGLATTDAEELARRRRMAAARRTRESERTSLLLKLVRTERQADQLREWISQRKADDEATPEMQRLVDWARARLSGMEGFLDSLELSRLLHTRNLFPEVDDLVDPLGEPPPPRPWGR
jgi:hypothetical protein